MTDPLAQVRAVAENHGLELRRAWPRDPDHLLLDLACDGRSVAGQWFADPSRAASVAASTGAPATGDRGVVLQPDGADRRLPALAELVSRPGAQLVAHRPERRAVVRRADGAYDKVVRPKNAAEVARAARAAAVPGLRVPEVLAVDEATGVVTTAALPGPTLHQLLRDGSPHAASAAREVGRALAVLHAAPVPDDATVHDAAAELAVLEKWEGLAGAFGVLPDHGPAASVELQSRPGDLVRVHRDLHDKQALIGPDGVGLLDFDLAAAGEAALDLANLLVHLELRTLQGLTSTALAREAAAAVLEGYAPTDSVLARLPAYDLMTRRRLAAVYGFRPAHAQAAAALLG